MNAWWILGFAAAFAVVGVGAVLLLGILWQARRIRTLAGVAAAVVGGIDTNTRSVWALTRTNKTADALLAGACAIEGNAAAIRGAVSHGARKNVA